MAAKEEARPRYQRKARHAVSHGSNSLTSAARNALRVAMATLFVLALVWGFSACMQAAYVDGYQDAKEACHG